MEDPELRRRRKLVERILKQWQTWGSLVQSQGLFSITIEGEEYHYYDMLNGLAALPPRQRQAVFLMCIEDRSEVDVARIMGFENTLVTPCQQYKAFGLARLLEYLDADPDTQAEMILKVQKYGKKPRKKRTPKVVA